MALVKRGDVIQLTGKLRADLDADRKDSKERVKKASKEMKDEKEYTKGRFKDVQDELDAIRLRLDALEA